MSECQNHSVEIILSSSKSGHRIPEDLEHRYGFSGFESHSYKLLHEWREIYFLERRLCGEFINVREHLLRFLLGSEERFEGDFRLLHLGSEREKSLRSFDRREHARYFPDNARKAPERAFHSFGSAPDGLLHRGYVGFESVYFGRGVVLGRNDDSYLIFSHFVRF